MNSVQLSKIAFLWHRSNEIHNFAGFIFRHDSNVNPSYERHLKTQEAIKGNDKKLAAQAVIAESDYLTKLILKIRQ